MTQRDQAEIHGSPGEGARTAGIARAFWPLLAVLFFCGYIVGAVLGLPVGAQAAGIVLVLSGVLLILGVRVSGSRIGAFFKGALGEEIVARELARLPGGFHVFHSVDVGGGLLMWRGGDIDHVVAGPTGIFVIETKNWRGKITLAGDGLRVDGAAPRRDPLEQVRHAVKAFRTRLNRAGLYDLDMAPVVCFASNRLDAPRAMCGDVRVCNASELLDVLTARTRRSDAPLDLPRLTHALEPGRNACRTPEKQETSR